MASPTVHADETLKALSRYLAGHPRVLWRYPRQEWTGKVWGLTDSNWAACPVTRKSTSATYLMLGKHPFFAASSTQTILSLSSGEAEFYGDVRCACRTLGLKSLMSDLSLEVQAEDVLRGKIDTSTVLHCGFNTPWHEDRLRLPSVREKNLAPGVGTKAGIPEDTMGRSASGGLRTWLRYVCTTLSELQLRFTLPMFSRPRSVQTALDILS